MDRPDLSHWPELANLTCEPLEGGLINQTYVAGEPPVAVVQRLNPIFGPEVHHDIQAVTSHLLQRGIPTPILLQTRDAEHHVVDPEGAVWRALSWIDGRTHHRVPGPREAAAAAAFIARWHRALTDFSQGFRHVRLGVHDTHGHMTRLTQILVSGGSHRLFSQVEPVACEVLARWADWEGSTELPERVCHGDLKISNLLFQDDGHPAALVDLDTLGRMGLDAELGDAWRSWCNQSTEDQEEAVFDLDIFEASARAYLAEHTIEQDEREALPGGVERICLELAARFAVDAIEERYFGWSDAVAGSRGEHNLIRARGQLSLARAVREARSEMEKILSTAQ